MSQLDTALHSLRAHAGVEHVLVLGRDGLLIQHVGDRALDAETVSAMVPGIAQGTSALGAAAGMGAAVTTVVQLAAGVAMITPLSDEILLALLLRPGVGFAPLLRDLAEQRVTLASLV